MRPGDGLSSFSKDNSANFLVKKKYNDTFRGVYNLRINEKSNLVLESKGLYKLTKSCAVHSGYRDIGNRDV